LLGQKSSINNSTPITKKVYRKIYLYFNRNLPVYEYQEIQQGNPVAKEAGVLPGGI
jgi:hypothetical protein